LFSLVYKKIFQNNTVLYKKCYKS